MKKESKGLSLLKNLDLAIAGVLLVVLIFLTFFGVARRYLFGKPLIWMEEFQGLLFLWITFLGAGAAFRYGSHVKIDMVLTLFTALPVKFSRYWITLLSSEYLSISSISAGLTTSE